LPLGTGEPKPTCQNEWLNWVGQEIGLDSAMGGSLVWKPTQEKMALEYGASIALATYGAIGIMSPSLIF